MKKSVTGFIFGLILALSVSVSAEVYQFILSPHSLFVDGEQIGQPMFLKDGTNYLPLRAVGEALGADVKYKDGRVDIVANTLEAVAADVKDSCVMVYAQTDYEISQGSGWMYNGYVVTARHVIENMESFKIETDDSSYVTMCKVYYVDPEKDIAILKPNNDLKLPSVTLGDADKLNEGEKLISITSPNAMKNSIDECVYSGKGSSINSDYVLISESGMDEGSSGGAIFNYNGELIGMVTKGEGEGHYALPIDIIKPILENLK